MTTVPTTIYVDRTDPQQGYYLVAPSGIEETIWNWAWYEQSHLVRKGEVERASRLESLEDVIHDAQSHLTEYGVGRRIISTARGLVKRYTRTNAIQERLDRVTDRPRNATRFNPAEGEWWVRCDAGHEHYGRHGAAGMLLVDAAGGDPRFLLQRRAAWVDHGNTWSIPGGALRAGETPQAGALREAVEEMGVLHISGEPLGVVRDEHGQWTYHTVMLLIDDPHHIVRRATSEQDECDWFTLNEMDGLPLHPGFAASWPRVLDTATAALIG